MHAQESHHQVFLLDHQNFFFLWPHGLQDLLVPQPEIEPMPQAVEVWRPKQEFLYIFLIGIFHFGLGVKVLLALHL